MRTTIRPTSRESKCPKCSKVFQHIVKIGFICPDCQTVPKKFVIDVHWRGGRDRICSDKYGKPLDSYQRANDLLSHVKLEIENHSFDPSKYAATDTKKFYTSILLEEFLQRKRGSIAPSYIGGYKKQVNRAKHFFGNSDVREIRKRDLFQYLEFLKNEEKSKGVPLKSKSIRNNFTNFKTFLNYLKKQEIIAVVPDFPSEEDISESLEKIILNEKAFHYAWFKTEDQINILNAIDNRHDRNITEFLMLHGCRPGEARALRVADVNIEAQSITIKSTFSKNALRQRRKGKKSKPYVIAIHPEMVDFFIKRVRNHPEAFIFINPRTGGPYRACPFELLK